MQSTISWPELAGRRVGVWGLGIEGRASVRKLRALGVDPVLVDDRPAEAGVRATAEGGLDELIGCDVVIKAPGISRYRDEVRRLEEGGVIVTGGLALWLAGADRSRVVCITGTKGKSTTTAIAAKLLDGLGHRVFAGGNLGTPPYDPELTTTPDYWVIEVSSYQAADIQVSPPVTAVTSLHPDHLPWHEDDVERYYADKLSLCNRPGAIVTVANGDSDLLRARERSLAPRVRWISADDEPDATWMTPLELLGTHNRRNALIARACLEELDVDHATDDEALARAAEGFVPLASRLTPIGLVNGVDFVDDSLSTNVLPTLAAVDAFPGRRVALLIGGSDRGIDYGPLASGIAARTSPTLVVIVDSESAPRMAEVFSHAAVETRSAPDLQAAARHGFEWARPDGVVLLSPAASSFDRFADYRDRAAAFAEAMKSCAGGNAGT
jgi:UDP-N-acetylmuramoyl-L-alanine---L-glutamate ligase